MHESSKFTVHNKSSLGEGRGLMHGIKIPQQDFALKMWGGGGIFAGHYGTLKIDLSCQHMLLC